ncbi:MAG: MBOAT family protein [Prevotella sp.]|nr:MBOAT family protein [Prevotella sp.]
MVFSDLFFIFTFLPTFILCYLLASGIDRWTGNNSNIAKNIVLVVFSLIFYAWGEPVYVFLMIGSVIINYFVGRLIDKGEGTGRKTALTIGLILNIAILGTFKYAGFFGEILQSLGLPVTPPAIALPIGISFYTFQSISYLIDVYRRESPVQRRFINLLLYISMFPQLIAGPIVRYGTVAKEIMQRRICTKDFAEGIYRFLIGLGKKVIIANQMSEIVDQFLVNGLSELSTGGAWIGVLAFTFQIYFDFSGYSDMAIGLGRCMGFHFNENFRHPYCCNSITDFWRRWHISLGSFFRDYVYIPMGGNRRHQALNILVVWFLTGMWHGASWNFIIWGLYFGLIVMIEKYTLLRVIGKIPSALLHVYSLLLVVTGWGIFYFDDFRKMTTFFQAYFGQSTHATDFTVESALTDHFWLWIVAIVLSMPVRDAVANGLQKMMGSDSHVYPVIINTSRILLSVIILILSTALLVGATNNAFIYTRF